jgi:hypothetical protein
MKTNRHRTLFQTITRSAFGAAALACCGLCATPSLAQAQDGSATDVSVCLEIESPEARLECFEARTEQMVRAREREQRANQRTADAAAPTAAAATAPAAPAASVASSETADPVDAPVEAEAPVELSRAERRALQRAEKRQRRVEEAAAAAVALAEAPSQIVATVTEVREIEPDMLLITLDNGQVWKQNQARRYSLLVGAEVRLRASRWGPSYRLTDPNVGSFILVERRQ